VFDQAGKANAHRPVPLELLGQLGERADDGLGRRGLRSLDACDLGGECPLRVSTTAALMPVPPMSTRE